MWLLINSSKNSHSLLIQAPGKAGAFFISMITFSLVKEQLGFLWLIDLKIK